jgi:hypothetical protein
MLRPKETAKVNEKNERNNHSGVHGMQAAELYNDKRQEEAHGEAGAAQILQVLPGAHSTSRDEVGQPNRNAALPQSR